MEADSVWRCPERSDKTHLDDDSREDTKRMLMIAPMKEMPGFIEGLVRALARCEDVDESTIVRLSCRLMRSPRTAVLLTCFAELGYCDSEQLLLECNRLLKVTGGR